ASSAGRSRLTYASRSRTATRTSSANPRAGSASVFVATRRSMPGAGERSGSGGRLASVAGGGPGGSVTGAEADRLREPDAPRPGRGVHRALAGRLHLAELDGVRTGSDVDLVPPDGQLARRQPGDV